MVFIDFQNFVNFHKKLPDFWAKNTRFFADAAKIWEKNFDGKVMRFFKKGPIDPISGRNVPQGTL